MLMPLALGVGSGVRPWGCDCRRGKRRCVASQAKAQCASWRAARDETWRGVAAAGGCLVPLTPHSPVHVHPAATGPVTQAEPLILAGQLMS